MANESDVRRIALTLPETIEEPQLKFTVRGKAIAWSWKERVHPKKARVPRYDMLAIRVRDEWEKQSLLEADPDVYFTEPHYNGYPAILVRLPAVGVAELKELLTNAWRVQAPRALVKELEEEEG